MVTILFIYFQVPIAVGMSSYQAMRLYKGQRIIASKGDQQTHWRVLQLIVFCACGILAGTIAGLLGLGGGFILAPLFLGLGIPPQVPFILLFFHKVSLCRFCMETTLIGDFFPQRWLVQHPFWQWHFLHLSQWWNITFSNVSQFLMVSMDT